MATKQTDPVDATRVSFRLPPEIAAELATQATRAGKSPNLVARDLVTNALERPDSQGHDLDAIRDELAAVHAAVLASAKSRVDIEPLRAQIAEVRDAQEAADGQRRRLEAVCSELLALCHDWRGKEQQRRSVFETLSTELAAIRPVVSTIEEQREVLVTLCAEIVRIGLDTRQIRMLRGDVATVANVLLPNAGKLTPEQATVWVQRTLLSQ